MLKLFITQFIIIAELHLCQSGLTIRWVICIIID